jgi:hypothetical protein
MKLQNITLFLLALVVMAACGGGTAPAPQPIDNTPSWFLNPPKDSKEFLYAVGIGKSRDKGEARQKAFAVATADMGQKLEVKVQALRKKFTEEVAEGGNSNFTDVWSNAIRTVVDQSIKGLSQENGSLMSVDAGTQYEFYILVSLPVPGVSSSLDNTLSRDKELYAKWKSSNAFKEMDETIANGKKE